MSEKAAPGPLMTTEEVAAAFAVRPWTVRRWITAGKLATITRPPHPFPRCFRAEVEAWMTGQPLSAEQVAELRDQLSQVRQP